MVKSTVALIIGLFIVGLLLATGDGNLLHEGAQVLIDVARSTMP